MLERDTVLRDYCAVPFWAVHDPYSNTVRTRIIEPEAKTLELPLLVRSGSFFFLFCLKLELRGSLFAVRSPPYPREGISDVLALGPIIRVLTVAGYLTKLKFLRVIGCDARNELTLILHSLPGQWSNPHPHCQLVEVLYQPLTKILIPNITNKLFPALHHIHLSQY